MSKAIRSHTVAEVDLTGYPAARMRTLLHSLLPRDVRHVLDAQLADAYAEWQATREAHGRARATWIATTIRVRLLVCAAYLGAELLARGVVRSAAVLVGGIAITAGLFLGLASAVSEKVEYLDADPAPKRPPIDFTRQEWREEPPPRTNVKPEPPKLPPGLPGGPSVISDPIPGEPEGPQPIWPRGPAGPGVEVVIDPGELTGPVAPPDLSCTPLFRAEPMYPDSAIQRRIEGYVTVRVAIDAKGSVSEARVLEAKPRGVFDGSVLRTVKRWRYRPADAVEGCAQTDVTLRFVLPD